MERSKVVRGKLWAVIAGTLIRKRVGARSEGEKGNSALHDTPVLGKHVGHNCVFLLGGAWELGSETY